MKMLQFDNSFEQVFQEFKVFPEVTESFKIFFNMFNGDVVLKNSRF